MRVTNSLGICILFLQLRAMISIETLIQPVIVIIELIL